MPQRPKLVDLTSLYVCYLNIPFRSETDKFPLTVVADIRKPPFDFDVFFSMAAYTSGRQDMNIRGNTIHIKPNKSLASVDCIILKMTAYKHVRIKVSYSYSSVNKHRRQATTDELFQRKNVEKINEAYEKIKDKVMSKREILRSRVDFPAKNKTTQILRIDSNEMATTRRMKSLIRDKKVKIARERNNEHYFEKVKAALIHTYSHDLKICREETENATNYRTHMRRALQGLWHHNVFFYKIFKGMETIIWKRRFFNLLEKVKDRKRIDTMKKIHECVKKNLIGKEKRLTQYVQYSMNIAGSLMAQSSNKRAKEVITLYILNSELYWKARLLHNASEVVDKSSLLLI